MRDRRHWTLALCVVIGCGQPDTGPSASAPDASASNQADAAPGAGCVAPDVLVVLDRTVSMAERPDGTKPPNTPAGYTESKWYAAVHAVEQLTSQFETSIRFGLELFPREPAGDVCITLAERLSGMTASNPDCEAGEVVVAPDATTAAPIASTLDPETTPLCKSTPIGAGLASAATELASIRTPDRAQYVLFVSDGADTCSNSTALANTDALADDGVSTFVVAFDNGAPGGVDKGLLNDMACAGHTAPSFPTGCTQDAQSHYRATDRSGTALFLTAGDATRLDAAFQQIAGSVCCGCVL